MTKSAVGITVKGVSKYYRLSRRGERKEALRRVDLTVAPGEFVGLLGPSGCGKTTLLNVIGGLDVADKGTVAFGSPMPTAAGVQRTLPTYPRIGYVFQEPRLLPWMSVRDNVQFVMDGEKAETVHRVDDWLARVGLKGYETYYPGQLSIGMQQRVAVARAFIVQPDILLMDEPFSSLDELTALQLRDELMNLWVDTGCTVVFVTHNPLEAVYLADRVVIMTSSPGRIVGDLDVGKQLPRPRVADDGEVWKLSRKAVRMLSGDGTSTERGDSTDASGAD